MRQLFRSRRRLAIFLLALAFLGLCALCALRETRTVLAIRDRRGDRQWSVVLPREEFVLGYTHSVMKTPVEERYRADPRLGLVMVETLYHSYGVGLPFLPEDGELTVDERGMVLRMDRVIGSLNMTISGIGEHWLEVEGRRWELAELLDGGGSITLSAQTLRCWRFSPASEPVLKTS